MQKAAELAAQSAAEAAEAQRREEELRARKHSSSSSSSEEGEKAPIIGENVDDEAEKRTQELLKVITKSLVNLKTWGSQGGKVVGS